MEGKSSSAEMINTYLDAIRTRVFDLEREMVFAGEIISYKSFRNKWSGVKIAPKMILEIFEVHNEELAQLIGKGFSASTLIRYKTSLRHTQSFMKWKHKLCDRDIKKLDYEFITSFAF